MCIYPPKEIENEWLRYNELKSSGLKKQANKALLDVIEIIKESKSGRFNDFLLGLCDKGLGGSLDNKIQHPLFVQCILPLLLFGLEKKSAREITYIVRSNSCGFGREIYNAIGDVSNLELLKIAHASEPNNQNVVNLIVHDYIESLYFGAHHLPECLIIDLEYSRNIISESAEFILNNRKNIKAELIEQHKYYSSLYRDYEIWVSENNGGDFAQWCSKNGRTYSWVTTVYYDK